MLSLIFITSSYEIKLLPGVEVAVAFKAYCLPRMSSLLKADTKALKKLFFFFFGEDVMMPLMKNVFFRAA